MIVVCTGCTAKFKVADEKVGPRGAKVRCSKCSTVFLVRHDEPVAPAPVRQASPPPEPGAGRVAPPPLPRRGAAARLEPGPAATPPPRATLDLDLEPADPRERAPEPLPAPPLPDDPFGTPFTPMGPVGGALADDPFAPRHLDQDPFAAVQAPIPDDLLRAPPAPPQQAAADPFDLDPFGGVAAEPRAGGEDLALEERSPAPARPRPESSAPLDDPFGGAMPPLDPSMVEFASGHPADVPPLAADLPGGSSPTGPAPVFAAAPAPLHVDPFASAAVDADPLQVAAPPARSAPPPDEPPGVAEGGPAAGRLRSIAVNAVSLAVLLAVALALLVFWRGGGRVPTSLRPSSLLAALTQRPEEAGPLAAAGVTSGLYERDLGAPLLFVRGEVVVRGPSQVGPVRVTVELVRGGQVLATETTLAGAVLGPEALHGAGDAAALARLAAEAQAQAPAVLQPGQSAPFLVAFTDYPDDLAGTSLRISVAEAAR